MNDSINNNDFFEISFKEIFVSANKQIKKILPIVKNEKHILLNNFFSRHFMF